MEFIPLKNFKELLKRSITLDQNMSVTFIDTGLVERPLDYGNNYNFTMITFNNNSATTTSNRYDFPYASSYDSFNTDEIYQVPNVIGTSKIISQGWTETGATMSIEISGQEGDIIKSLFFVRKLGQSPKANSDSVIYALKLNKPITIDNTGKAYFNFSISYD